MPFETRLCKYDDLNKQFKVFCFNLQFPEVYLNLSQNELEMVNSEHEKNRLDDVWRTNQVTIQRKIFFWFFKM